MTIESIVDDIINMSPRNIKEAELFLYNKYSHLDYKFLVSVSVELKRYFV